MRGLTIIYVEDQDAILAEISALLGRTIEADEVEEIIRTAALQAEEYALAGQRLVRTLLDASGTQRRQVWEGTPGFARYLGEDMPGRITRLAIARRFRRLVRVLSNRTVIIRMRSQSTDRDSTPALNRGGPFSHRTFQILPKYFERKPARQARTILHEYCHNWMFDARERDAAGNTIRNADGEIDRVYGRAECEALALSDPARARRNPDNITFFSIDAFNG